MSKVSVAMTGIAFVIMIVLIGWTILSAVSGVVDTNNAGMQNTTSAIGSGNTIFGIGGLGGIILMIAIILGITLALAYFVNSEKNYNKLGKIAEFLIDSVYYFAFGLAALAIIVVPGYLIYLLYNYAVLDGQAGNVIETLKWVVLLVGAFFAISGLGYAFKKKIVDKYLKLRKAHIDSRKNKDLVKA